MKLRLIGTALAFTLVTLTGPAMSAPPPGAPAGAPAGAMDPILAGPRPAGIAMAPCRADLSVDLLSISKPSGASTYVVNVIIRNAGTEAFSAPPIYTGIVVEATNGGTSAKISVPMGDISSLAPGAGRRLAAVLPRTAFDSFEFWGELRAYINYGPDAPRCGLDPNASNNELGMTNAQIRDWLTGATSMRTVRR
jgi:hypothetical protein